MLAICRVAALAAVAEGTIRYVASDDLRRSGKNDFSMHWLFGERFFHSAADGSVRPCCHALCWQPTKIKYINIDIK